MGKVIFKDNVLDYLDELVYTLFKEEYFSYSENAQLYVDKIVDFIIVEINSFPHKNTSQKLQYLGGNYIFINPIIERLGMFSLKKRIKNF